MTHRATSATELGELTALLDDVILADLAWRGRTAVGAESSRCSAVSTDVGHLLTALPPLARVLRYGNVRKTDAALVEPVVAGPARTDLGRPSSRVRVARRRRRGV